MNKELGKKLNKESDKESNKESFEELKKESDEELIKIINPKKDENTTDWYDKNQFKKPLTTIDRNKFNHKNKVGKLKFEALAKQKLNALIEKKKQKQKINALLLNKKYY